MHGYIFGKGRGVPWLYVAIASALLLVGVAAWCAFTGRFKPLSLDELLTCVALLLAGFVLRRALARRLRGEGGR